MLGGAASVLSPELAEFERRTGHQMVVAAFQSLDGESLEDYSNRLFRSWRIGAAKANDGVLFALFVQDRKWRVEVGYGLEPLLTDLEAAEIARSGVPQFRAGDYGGGAVTVVRGLEARLEGGARPRAPQGRPYDREEIELLIAFGLAPGLMFVLLLIIGRNAGSTVGRRYTGWRDGGWGGGGFGGGGFGGGGWGGGGFGGGGFSGGGGSSGGGGASGGW